jgi:arylsulfatase
VATAAALACLLSACRVEKMDSSPISLLERAPEIATPVALANETRKAISVDLASQLEFEVKIPDAPLLSFAIGASSRDRPTLLAPVVFRVLVGETEVFREQIRRVQGGKWFPRDVDLSRWAGETARIVLEASRGEGGVEGAESHVVAHWGNPVARSQVHRPDAAPLILVSIDCLRADHVGAYGYSRRTTPNLDAFAREAVLFQEAMAVSSYTLPTHASMLTGLPPSFHGATQRRRISPSVDFLPELLSQRGYRVLGVVSAPFLAPVYGFADGFDTYRLSSERAAGLVDQALALLDEGAGIPRFLFLHIFDVHLPYSPPGEFIDRFDAREEDISRLHAMIEKRVRPATASQVDHARRLYDGEIAYVDRELGRFFRELQDRGLYDPSLIVVTADHGEAFFEHGFWEHGRPWRGDGPGLYQEIVHVPLLVKRPDVRRGVVVSDLVRQTDIFPTFLEAAGMTHDGPWARSLLRERAAEGAGWALSEFLATPAKGGAILQVALRQGDLKYSASYSAETIEDLYSQTPREEALYDLATDPVERRNLLRGSKASPAGALREVLRRYLEAAREHRAHQQEGAVNPDPDLQRQLESLGYIEH